MCLRSTAVCNTLSTVYVTFPGSPVTKTVFAASSDMPVTVKVPALETKEEDALTVYQTIPATQIFSVVRVSSTTDRGDGQGTLASLQK